MSILNKLAIQSLKLNKKRTISTMIGMILSSALICAVLIMLTSFQATLVQNAINETGYYHIKLENMTEEDIQSFQANRDIKGIYTTHEIGYGKLENGQNEYKPYVHLISMDKNIFEQLKFQLLEGRFPTNEKEIVMSEHIRTNGKVDYQIGDTISMAIGKRQTMDGIELISQNPYVEGEEELTNLEEYTFTIVGIMKRPNYIFEDYSAPGYTILTTQMLQGKQTVYLSLRKPIEYQKSFSQLLGAESYYEVETHSENLKYHTYTINRELLRWEAMSFSSTTLHMLYAVCGVVIVIIMVTSIFCIRNSFAIATTEKIKMYGMLSSVGATKKQMKSVVLWEALWMGVIGILLGLLSGIVAVYILMAIVNELIGKDLLSHVDGIIVCISWWAILLSVLLGSITIYFSAIASARKASRTSPIENLRNTNEIKMTRKKLKTPKIIEFLFQTGGVLAYKNLKRSKKKYRTTVISLTVSIFVFITMSAFMHYAFYTTGRYYVDYDYNVTVSSNSNQDISEEEIRQMTSLEKVEEAFVVYWDRQQELKIKELDKINLPNGLQEELAVNPETGEVLLEEETNHVIYTGEEYMALELLALDNATFAKYAKKIGVDYDKIKESGVLCDTYLAYDVENKKQKEVRIYHYQPNDTIEAEYKNQKVNIPVGAVTNVLPYGYENSQYEGGYLVVNRDVYSNFDFTVKEILMESKEPEKLTEEIENLKFDVNVSNLEAFVQEERKYTIIISIFLYGFITVITFIGVTNIFNTITSNMELRQREFAILKSIGMTKKEFNRMIHLETIFYSMKSLFYGIILGIGGSYVLYKAFAIKLDSGMYLPIQAIGIAILFVFILVFMIMRYSISKINRQNTIETIRKENI